MKPPDPALSVLISLVRTIVPDVVDVKTHCFGPGGCVYCETWEGDLDFMEKHEMLLRRFCCRVQLGNKKWRFMKDIVAELREAKPAEKPPTPGPIDLPPVREI